MGLEIKIARSNAEKEAIYRFRYDIYITEMKRAACADHENRLIKDWMDETGVQIYAVKDKELVGIVRTNLRRDGSVEFESDYLLNSFSGLYPEKISTSTKLMVKKIHRKNIITFKLLANIYEYGIHNDVSLDFINVNSPLDKFYQKMGYRKYKSNFKHPEFGEVVPMVLFLNDVGYLKKIKSPFLRVISKFESLLLERYSVDLKKLKKCDVLKTVWSDTDGVGSTQFKAYGASRC